MYNVFIQVFHKVQSSLHSTELIAIEKLWQHIIEKQINVCLNVCSGKIEFLICNEVSLGM